MRKSGRVQFNMFKYLNISSVIVSCFCIYKMYVFDEPFWLMPFVYMLLIHLYSMSRPIMGAGHVALMIAMACRYLMLPLSIYGTESLSTSALQYGYLYQAIILMVYEMIAIFIVLFIYDNKYKKRIYCNCNNKEMPQGIAKHIKPVYFYVVFFIWLCIAILYKNLISGFSVLLSGALDQMREIEQVDYEGSNIIGGILWETLCVWLFSYLVFKQYGILSSTNLKKPVIRSLIYTLAIVVISFIDQSGLSRWFTIVITGSAVAVLFKLFPHQKRMIVSTIVIPSVVLIIFVTLFKNAGLILGEGTIWAALSALFDPLKIDTYFSGPVNVNNALYVYYNSRLDLTTLINDICNNMPIVNHLMDIRATSVYAYNASLGRIFADGTGDQIIPLIGQSIIYFSPILAPTLSCISVIIVCWADYKFLACKDFRLFCLAFIAIWFAVSAMMLNLTITLSWVYIRIIPFLLAFCLTNKIAGIGVNKYINSFYCKKIDMSFGNADRNILFIRK